MQYDVTIDRDKYIGGSDIPAIMGISPFKTRWELLLEKSGLKPSEFEGNRYTEYGNIIEPQIRDYINVKYNTDFEPNRVIDGDIRYHSDGFNDTCVLEIKSTSHIYETVDEYTIYLVQLIKGMEKNNVENGMLCVYERPDDFNPVFEPKRLQIFEITANQYKSLLEKVNHEIERFRADLKRLKENPLLTEQDFLSNDLVTIANKVVALENQMAAFKTLETTYKEMKQALFEAMAKYEVKSWETPGGVKISKVDGAAATSKTVTEFDLETFKKENPVLHDMYLKNVTKKTLGRAGYVCITIPK